VLCKFLLNIGPQLLQLVIIVSGHIDNRIQQNRQVQRRNVIKRLLVRQQQAEQGMQNDLGHVVRQLLVQIKIDEGLGGHLLRFSERAQDGHTHIHC